MFDIKNQTTGAFAVDYVYLQPGETRSYPYVTQEVLDAKVAGYISVTPDPGSAAPSAITSLTDSSTGTSGGNTIAAVTDITTAKNAIATLAAKLNAVVTAVNTSNAASNDSNTSAIANIALQNSQSGI